jgi:hypothetical protein
MATYYTFLRSAKNFGDFARNPRITIDTDLTREQAYNDCQEYNKNRTQDEIDNGTKLEFDEE